MSGQNQTTQVVPTAQVAPARRRGIVRRSSSGILNKRATLSSNNAGCENSVAALPTKRRGSYQQLKRNVAAEGEGGAGDSAPTHNAGANGNDAPSDVGSASSAEEPTVQNLIDSPELKQTHWEQFGTAQVVLLSAGADEELMGFYEQALSAEGYDNLRINEVEQISGILKHQKAEPDLLLFLCVKFDDHEAKVLSVLRGINGHIPVMVLCSGEGDCSLALQGAQEYLQHTEDVDELIIKINVQLRKRHQAKLMLESMIEQAQKLLTSASLKKSTLFTLSEEIAEGESQSQEESLLLRQRQQVQQVLNTDQKLRNQAVSLVQLLDADVRSWDALLQDNTLKQDLVALKQLL